LGEILTKCLLSILARILVVDPIECDKTSKSQSNKLPLPVQNVGDVNVCCLE